MQEYHSNVRLRQSLRERTHQQEHLFSDPSLYHYALFSDNVLAASVVVRSLDEQVLEPMR